MHRYSPVGAIVNISRVSLNPDVRLFTFSYFTRRQLNSSSIKRRISDRTLLCPRLGGIMRWSASGVRLSVCLSVRLMSCTSALTRKPKGLGRRNFAQGYPRSHATPTPTSRSKGQKSRSWGGGILWRPPSRTACFSSNPADIQIADWQTDKQDQLYNLLQLPLTEVITIIIIIITKNTSCRTRSLFNATFSCLITWRSSSSKSAAVYKISSKADNFSLRYGDITILKMAPSAVLELFHHHTRPPTKFMLPAAAACQISCQSDTQIWRYSYLNLSHIWLKMPIQAPKMGVFRNFGPLNVISHHRDPQKGTSLRKSASFKLSTVKKIRWGVWPVGELTESVTDKETDTHR